MNVIRGCALIAAVGLLGACTGFKSHTEVEALNEAQAVGSPFTQQLAAEYREFANSEQNVMFDYPDALHFARKGLAAAAGEVVLPEPISDWNLKHEHVDQLSAARARLIVAFDIGAREIAPIQAAVAQARFDCWIEQQEENWQEKDIVGCRNEFEEAISKLEGALQAPPPAGKAEPVMPPVENIPAAPSEPMAPEDAMYLVFFDFDSSKIGSGGESVLDAVAEEINSRSLTSVNVVGHTDTAGPKKYNRKLSLRRANSVREALVNRGVSAQLLKVDNRGEDELLVETADNVREPANRRVTVTFE